ncbi:unnamed protein product [Prorocentrum cordatum]|uniref:Nucleotide-diphospho-sugar transferase domain-containing protein n=1 Tax=Prorocentrum cordatum TaxID=2364126 RepID=A0ABN9SJA6_9DINO|nr:unnamed protein product [Polarella glacialis]
MDDDILSQLPVGATFLVPAGTFGRAPGESQPPSPAAPAPAEDVKAVQPPSPLPAVVVQQRVQDVLAGRPMSPMPPVVMAPSPMPPVVMQPAQAAEGKVQEPIAWQVREPAAVAPLAGAPEVLQPAQDALGLQYKQSLAKVVGAALAAPPLQRALANCRSCRGCAWRDMRAAALAAASLATALAEGGRAEGPPSWLPRVELEDFECRRALPSATADWPALRSRVQALVSDGLEADSLVPTVEDEAATSRRKALQVELLDRASRPLLRFEAAIAECPFGAVTASLLVACLAHMPRAEVSEEALPWAYETMLSDFARQPFDDLVARDLRLLLSLAPMHVVVAAEWGIFSLLNLYVGRLRKRTPDPDHPVQHACAGTSVSGHSSEKVMEVLRRHTRFASGKSIEGLKFLRGLDPIVSSVMRDPTDFSAHYVHSCPAGAAAFALASAMLSLMTNPSLFEKFVNMAQYVLQAHAEEVVAGADAWGVFHAFAKLAVFATRSFDLVWSMEELLPLPEDPAVFDRLRLDGAARRERLSAAAEAHGHEATRSLARFLLSAPGTAQPPGPASEAVVYLTAVGGAPFTNHLPAFVRRAVAVRLPALVIACMDGHALERCEAVRAEEGAVDRVCCMPALEGHVVLVKHAFIPVLLSAAVDTVWIDFDTFILRDPTPALRSARDAPGEMLPARERMRFGSFLFHNASDLCALAKMCDPRQHWPYTISGEHDPSNGVEMLVTEHWDARCLNNGLFYVRATQRPLVFFTMFLTKLYVNPYTDNQNLFDSFLAHSTLDAAAPSSRPLLNYRLLDIERQFACAEGHLGSADSLVTFHFWSSDFKTREVAKVGHEAAGPPSPEGGTIRMRDGTARTEKVTAGKAELFGLFLGGGLPRSDGVPAEAADFIDRVRVPPPTWKGMCSVTAVGIEDLVDEKLLRGEQELVDWAAATAVSGAARGAALDDGDPAGPPAGEGVRGPAAELAEGDCAGVPLAAWSDGLAAVAELEDASLLLAPEAAAVKALLRSRDVGCLLTVRAHQSRGAYRLAAELRLCSSGEGGGRAGRQRRRCPLRGVAGGPEGLGRAGGLWPAARAAGGGAEGAAAGLRQGLPDDGQGLGWASAPQGIRPACAPAGARQPARTRSPARWTPER